MTDDEHRDRPPDPATPIWRDDWRLFTWASASLVAHVPLAAGAARVGCDVFDLVLAAALLAIAFPFAVGVRLVGRTHRQGRINGQRGAAAAALILGCLGAVSLVELPAPDRCDAVAAVAPAPAAATW